MNAIAMDKILEKAKGLAFYVVVNSDGQFFRRKGYRGGYGKTWVDDLLTARVYVRIGQARSIVTFFANHYKNYPPPSIVRLVISASEIQVIDEAERVKQARLRKEKLLQTREVRQRKSALERAKRDLEDAQRRLAAAGVTP